MVRGDRARGVGQLDVPQPARLERERHDLLVVGLELGAPREHARELLPLRAAAVQPVERDQRGRERRPRRERALVRLDCAGVVVRVALEQLGERGQRGHVLRLEPQRLLQRVDRVVAVLQVLAVPARHLRPQLGRRGDVVLLELGDVRRVVGEQLLPPLRDRGEPLELARDLLVRVIAVERGLQHVERAVRVGELALVDPRDAAEDLDLLGRVAGGLGALEQHLDELGPAPRRRCRSRRGARARRRRRGAQPGRARRPVRRARRPRAAPPTSPRPAAASRGGDRRRRARARASRARRSSLPTGPRARTAPRARAAPRGPTDRSRAPRETRRSRRRCARAPRPRACRARRAGRSCPARRACPGFVRAR